MRVIEQALESVTPIQLPEKSPQLKTFPGGSLVFCDRHVELQGIKIVSRRGNARSIAVLQSLARKDVSGRFVRMSADELARAVGQMAGANTITASIQTLRNNTVARLRNAGIACGPEDLIAHSEQGYYLREWITLHVTGEDSVTADVPANVPAMLHNVPADGPANDPEDGAINPRQEWILNELRSGTDVRRVHVERQFCVAEKTAKRDLSDLVARGMIVYMRHGRAGHYCIHSGHLSLGKRAMTCADER